MKDHFRAKLRVAPEINVVDRETLKNKKYPEASRKPQVFIDLRR